jgi:hypothetical protein
MAADPCLDWCQSNAIMMLKLLLAACCWMLVSLQPAVAAFLNDLKPKDIAVINVVSPGFGPPDTLRFHVEPEYPTEKWLDSMAYNVRLPYASSLLRDASASPGGNQQFRVAAPHLLSSDLTAAGLH